jgi:hypothetical protein
MPSLDYRKKQNEDVDKATKEYNVSMSKGEKDLSAHGMADKMMQRRNLLDKLNNDLNDAGRSKYEKNMWK